MDKILANYLTLCDCKFVSDHGKNIFKTGSNNFTIRLFLVPTGAKVVTLSLCLSVCPIVVCMSVYLSICSQIAQSFRTHTQSPYKVIGCGS